MEKLSPVSGGQKMRLLQERKVFVRERERSSHNKRADCVRGKNDGHEREERVVDESARVDCNLIEAEQKGYDGRHHRVQAQKWRERYEDAYRESKRRTLRRVINREQTADSCAKHKRLVNGQW